MHARVAVTEENYGPNYTSRNSPSCTSYNSRCVYT